MGNSISSSDESIQDDIGAVEGELLRNHHHVIQAQCTKPVAEGWVGEDLINPISSMDQRLRTSFVFNEAIWKIASLDAQMKDIVRRKRIDLGQLWFYSNQEQVLCRSKKSR